MGRGRRKHKTTGNPRHRTIQEGNLITNGWWTVYYPDGSTYSWPQNGPSYHYYSSIDDYVGNRTLWNPVSHFKYSGSSGVVYPCYNGGDVHMSYNFPDNILDPEAVLAMVPVPSSSQLERLSKSALQRASSWMPEQTSVANFLLELREGVRGIIPELKSFKDCLGNLHLGLQFGTISFTRDLKKLFGVWGAVQKRLRYLRKNNGRENWVRAHRSATSGNAMVEEDHNIPDDSIIPVWSNLPDEFPAVAHRACMLHVVPESVVTTVHVNILVYFFVKELWTFWNKLDMLSAALGLNNPAKIAWNNTRMSWLLEYFVKVGPYLDKLAGKPFGDLQKDIEIRAAWTSVKTVFSLEVYTGTLGSCSLKPAEPDWTKVGVLTVTKYDRVPGLPHLSEDALLECNLTPQQMGILVALGESRLHWERSKWTKWAARKWGPWLSGAKPKLGFKQPPRWFMRRFRVGRPLAR